MMNQSSKKLDLRLIPQPGMSLVGIDAGTTTGIAVWDAWDQRLYVDHIDAGRGRKVRHRVMAGIIESQSRYHHEKAVLKRWKGIGAGGGYWDDLERSFRATDGKGRPVRPGRTLDLETLVAVEGDAVTLLCDMLMAVGPKSLVMLEDFVLGVTGGTSGDRRGLSSVRIAHRLVQAMEDRGLLSGDAWRMWQGHSWAGEDGRGWRIRGGRSGVPSFQYRLAAVERWRLTGEYDMSDERVDKWHGADRAGAVWGGRGVKLKWNMPANRRLPGCATVAEMDDWMRAHGLWMKNMRHGMDALQHVLVAASRTGSMIQVAPERLWESANVRKSKRV